MLTWSNDKWPLFFIEWPVVIFTAITGSAAVVQVFVCADQVGESGNPLWPVVVDTEIQVGSTTIGLAAVYADTGKFGLQGPLIAPVVFVFSRRDLAAVFGLWILK
jgi:hypothetical protein